MQQLMRCVQEAILNLPKGGFAENTSPAQQLKSLCLTEKCNLGKNV